MHTAEVCAACSNYITHDIHITFIGACSNYITQYIHITFIGAAALKACAARPRRVVHLATLMPPQPRACSKLRLERRIGDKKEKGVSEGATATGRKGGLDET